MSRFKGKINASSERRSAEYRKTGGWLNKNIRFNNDLQLQKDQKIKIKKLFSELNIEGYKQEQKTRDLEVLICNLIHQNRKPISISLSGNSWTKSRYNKTSTYIIKLVDIIKKKGLIEMKKGYHTKNESRTTRIWATNKLLEYCQELPPHIISQPSELVELKDWKGKLIEYKDTERTWKIRAILTLVNDVNQKADIRYAKHKLSTNLVAIFKEDFSLYGRLHTRGYRHYQGMAGDEREEITINGSLVVELDYSGLHPHLLYAEKGKQYFGDPYSVINDNPIARPFLKQILLCLLNSENEIQAEKAANYWLHNNDYDRLELNNIGIAKARPLIEQFQKAHVNISEYFCKGKKTGMQIMNKDSKIALDVINHFAKLDIPILAIHDSFIVQKQYQVELKKVMFKMYQKHTKTSAKTSGFRIKIK